MPPAPRPAGACSRTLRDPSRAPGPDPVAAIPRDRGRPDSESPTEVEPTAPATNARYCATGPPPDPRRRVPATGLVSRDPRGARPGAARVRETARSVDASRPHETARPRP